MLCSHLASLVVAGACTATTLATERFEPVDMTGLRSFNGGGNVLLLTFDAVKTITEDRTIAHFDVTGFSDPVCRVTLDIPVDNIDEGPPGGTFDLYVFEGDGVVSTDEWDAGDFFHRFTDVDGNDIVLSIDVTDLVRTYRENGAEIMAFNFQGGPMLDRYWLNGIVGLPCPTLTATDATDLLCAGLCPEDVDGDGDVGVEDVLAIIRNAGACLAMSCPADVDRNGVVDACDLVEVVRAFGGCR